MTLRSAEEIMISNNLTVDHGINIEDIENIIQAIKIAQREALEAAELYARSKWESGLDAAIKKFEEAKEKADTLRDVVYLDGVLTILDLTKPEFKP